MQSSLCCGPLCLSCFLAKILLPCKGSLHHFLTKSSTSEFMSKYKFLSSLLGRRVDLLSNSINYNVGHKMLAKNCYFLHKHFSSGMPWHHSDYMNLKHLVYQCILKRSVYLAIEQIVPCLPTQDVTNCKLDRIKREVENKAVQPNDSCPSPPNALDLGKSPICIYCEECCYLWSYPQWHSSDNFLKRGS